MVAEGKGVGEQSRKCGRVDRGMECRNIDLLRTAVPRATSVAAGDDSFSRGRDVSGSTTREGRGFFRSLPMNGAVGAPERAT